MPNNSLNNLTSNHPTFTIERFIICVDDDQDFLSSMEFFLPDNINMRRNATFIYRFLFFDNPQIALNTFKELINSKYPRVKVSEPELPPDLGAALMAKKLHAG